MGRICEFVKSTICWHERRSADHSYEVCLFQHWQALNLLQTWWIYNNPFLPIFLFRPKSWSILNWLFSRFWPLRMTTDRMRCAAHSGKRAIWLPEIGNADNVINLNPRRIDYFKIKRTALQISKRSFGGLSPRWPSLSPSRPSSFEWWPSS